MIFLSTGRYLWGTIFSRSADSTCDVTILLRPPKCIHLCVLAAFLLLSNKANASMLLARNSLCRLLGALLLRAPRFVSRITHEESLFVLKNLDWANMQFTHRQAVVLVQTIHNYNKQFRSWSWSYGNVRLTPEGGICPEAQKGHIPPSGVKRTFP
ncbi:hypothetical protein POM88_013085 [Heracleum sosnowskyi]|uniref:Uncharacterized protein n=1 Tax=Heracleum sosnowskyi TaxID=360622 RepID=A0AAD8IXP8_9APIA|nr:hypothetical protein POM88_013085 [Heracleum sosnowskyi]